MENNIITLIRSTNEATNIGAHSLLTAGRGGGKREENEEAFEWVIGRQRFKEATKKEQRRTRHERQESEKEISKYHSFFM